MSTATILVVQEDLAVASPEQLAALCGLSVDELALLAEHGLLPALANANANANAGQAPASFGLHYMLVAQAARRLRDDFELDGNGWLLAVRLWMRLQETEAELRRVQATLSRFLG